jgi:hypothetical protein
MASSSLVSKIILDEGRVDFKKLRFLIAMGQIRNTKITSKLPTLKRNLFLLLAER